MELVGRETAVWAYLPEDLKGLISDGEKLVDHAAYDGTKVSDYSYLVFPFSKAYEGFLKRFFLDLSLIKEDEYYGDDIRIGRILNPHFIHENNNVFNKVCNWGGSGDNVVADALWKAWKRGRNQVFHYFPHNFRKLTFDEALDVIAELLSAMDGAVTNCNLKTP